MSLNGKKHTELTQKKKNQYRAKPGGAGLRSQIFGRIRQEVWKLKVYAGYTMGHKSPWQPAFIHRTTDSIPAPTQTNQDKKEEEEKTINES